MRVLVVLAGIVAVCCVEPVISELTCPRAKATSWSYLRQDKWPGLCKSGKSQSPIALTDKSAIRQSNINALVYENGNINNFEVTNNGHTIEINLANYKGTKPRLSGGGLAGKYVLSNIHFHWQSEHVINGKRYPLESHMVFTAERFSTVEAALAAPFGVTVLATVYQQSDKVQNRNFQVIDAVVPQIAKHPDKTVTTSQSINVFDFLPKDSQTFYKYTGSLTTPNCNENINWLVLKTPSSITRKELQVLTNICAKESPCDPVRFNNRRLQNINQRTVSLRQG